ncbi:MAG: YjbF family lipoprotein [Gemmobacter sp.]|nr:YjbF family lipoprotein [Gemmobacter sp.]
MTVQRLRLLGTMLAGLAVLAACSSEKADLDAFKGARAVLGAIGKKPSANSLEPTLTRAQADASALPLLVATIESRNSTAVLARFSTNAGTETFTTPDRTMITTRDGVMISTRGLGADLMSAAVPTRAQIAAGSGSHRRVHDTLNGGDVTVRNAFDCTLSTGASETVTIVGLSYPTRTVAESCSGTTGTFENRYWIDSRGIIRQSRQWADADLGYLRLSNPSR